MKTTFAFALAMAAFSAPLTAQGAGPAAIASQQEAMKTLSWMDGRWRGTAVTQLPGGEHRITQTERIGAFLGGAIKVIEGRGFEADGRLSFNAFGVLSYNPVSKTYALRSYAQGQEGTFKFAPIAGEQGYIWELPVGPMTIRYTARIESGKWHEVGDRVMPGKEPVRFFDMVLTRVGDTDWPDAGGMTPR